MTKSQKYNVKRQFINKGVGKPDRHMQKNEIGHYLHQTQKLTQNEFKHLILRPEAIKTPKKKQAISS